ncbi:FUSC family protein [Nesterenkonia sp. MY13]|uniref:FUSC family protein n=1 Tax=Nesterenkonia sedimenti TaxID=1463632 RepID=A0A7X8TM74_9MICC|nr:FUSC family protein [Nesterenkonia sedimenti]NLS11116.1 FUSC family protein [Nesterenkonia sedimenti]
MSSVGRYFRHLFTSARRLGATRVRTGAVRARRSILPALQMTAAGILAYITSERLLGHETPLFAAVAALIAMGFTKEPQLRKVVEVAVGCTLGVLLADMLIHGLGQGVHTAVIAVFLAVMLARFLDPGPLLAMQMGLQALLVVMVPVPTEAALGPFTRSLDAVVGGGVALLITLITPKDPRGEPLRELRTVTEAITSSLRDIASALRSSDSRQAWHALIRARGLQTQIDESTKALTSAKELTFFSPAHRRHRHYVRRLDRVADKLDLAVRSLRVTARRTVSAIDHASLSDSGTQSLAGLMQDLADASVQLSRAVAESGPGFNRAMNAGREALGSVATELHPDRLGIDDLEGEALVLLIRTMVVDLLEATGADHDEAETYLPEL